MNSNIQTLYSMNFKIECFSMIFFDILNPHKLIIMVNIMNLQLMINVAYIIKFIGILI